MIRILLILLVLLGGSEAKSQQLIFAPIKNALPAGADTSTRPILILFNGESNSGGQALNSDATTEELAARRIVILNNGTYALDSLHIGVNNNIGHSGITCCTTHGWELELANGYDSLYFSLHPVYIVKTGQGGSRVAQWGDPGAYHDSMYNRLEAAYNLISAVHQREPVVIVFLSIGINDRIAGTSIPDYQTGLESMIAILRADVNTIAGTSVTVPIIQTRFDGMTANGNEIYEGVFTDLEETDPNYYPISSLGDALMFDGNHWSYAGFKTLTRKMIGKLLDILGGLL